MNMRAFVAPVCSTRLMPRMSTSPASNPASSPTAPYKSDAAVTLFSVPISCFAARARLVVYAKELTESQVEVVPPAVLGGSKSAEYLALNPLGKVPTVIAREDDGTETELFESTAIVEYLAERFANMAPSFVPASRAARARGRMVAALLDNYVCPHHPFLYKKLEPGTNRAAGVEQMKIGFDAIERVLDEDGPFVAGKELSVGDCALWGNLAFYEFMIPTFFQWRITDGRPKLHRWISDMRENSEPARRVYEEVYRALEAWWDGGRWEKLEMPAFENPKRFSS